MIAPSASAPTGGEHDHRSIDRHAGAERVLARYDVIPIDWKEQGEASWWMRLRCGECESVREVVVSDAVAQRYDQRLDLLDAGDFAR